MKYFAIADIHSFYNEMIEALTSAGFECDNPNHILISCGDLLDRGNQTKEVLKYINKLPKERKILIRGNHEDLLEACIERKEFYSNDLHNGTIKTIMALCGHDEDYIFRADYHPCFDKVKKNRVLKKYLSCLQDYAEIDDYIFCHGWVPNPKYSPSEDWRLGDWKHARWANGIQEWYMGRGIPSKTIVCGHWHTSWGHAILRNKGTEWNADKKHPTACFDIFQDEGIIALDACTAYSHKVNCFVFESNSKEN